MLAAAGHRCIAPDLVGFGRSDKPAEPGDYSHQRHVDWMAEAISGRLGLAGMTLVGQDRGGLIGPRLLATEPDRFARVVAAKAGARVFPLLVPTSPDDPAHEANTGAWDVLLAYDRPFLCAFSDGDPITRGGEGMFIGRVPGTAGQPHTSIEGAGHFLQEDKGEQLAQVIADFIAAT